MILIGYFDLPEEKWLTTPNDLREDIVELTIKKYDLVEFKTIQGVYVGDFDIKTKDKLVKTLKTFQKKAKEKIAEI